MVGAQPLTLGVLDQDALTVLGADREGGRRRGRSASQVSVSWEELQLPGDRRVPDCLVGALGPR